MKCEINRLFTSRLGKTFKASKDKEKDPRTWATCDLQTPPLCRCWRPWSELAGTLNTIKGQGRRIFLQNTEEPLIAKTMPEKASWQVGNNQEVLRGLPLPAPRDWRGARGFPTALALGHIIRELGTSKQMEHRHQPCTYSDYWLSLQQRGRRVAEKSMGERQVQDWTRAHRVYWIHHILLVDLQSLNL